MNVPLKLAGFVGALGVAFGGAFAVGAVLDPTTPPPAPPAAHGSAPHSSSGNDSSENDSSGNDSPGHGSAGNDSGPAPSIDGGHSVGGGGSLPGLATS
nr:hypothetical protein [Micromonospora sp. DSM 115978]